VVIWYLFSWIKRLVLPSTLSTYVTCWELSAVLSEKSKVTRVTSLLPASLKRSCILKGEELLAASTP